MMTVDEFNEKENGKSIAWIKHYDQNCCYPSCKDCFKFQDFDGCIDCKPDFYKEVNSCVRKCSNGYYPTEEDGKKVCKECHSTCK